MGVERINLGTQQIQRGMITQQMMEALHRQPPIMFDIVGNHVVQQRRNRQIDAVPARIETPAQLLGNRTVMRIQRNFQYRQSGLAPHGMRLLG